MRTSPKFQHLHSSVKLTSANIPIENTGYSIDFPVHHVVAPVKYTAQAFPALKLGTDEDTIVTSHQLSFIAPDKVDQTHQVISTAILQKSSYLLGDTNLSHDLETTSLRTFVDHEIPPPATQNRLNSLLDLGDATIPHKETFKTSYQDAHSVKLALPTIERQNSEGLRKNFKGDLLLGADTRTNFTTTTQHAFQGTPNGFGDNNPNIHSSSSVHTHSSIVLGDADSRLSTYSPQSTQKQSFTDPRIITRPFSAPAGDVRQDRARPTSSALTFRSSLAMGDKKIKLPASTQHASFQGSQHDGSTSHSPPLNFHHAGDAGNITGLTKESYFVTGKSVDFQPPSYTTFERHSMDLQKYAPTLTALFANSHVYLHVRSHIPKGPFTGPETYITTSSNSFAPLSPVTVPLRAEEAHARSNQLRASHFTLASEVDAKSTFKTTTSTHYPLPTLSTRIPPSQQQTASQISNLRFGDAVHLGMGTHSSVSKTTYTAPPIAAVRTHPTQNPQASNFHLA